MQGDISEIGLILIVMIFTAFLIFSGLLVVMYRQKRRQGRRKFAKKKLVMEEALLQKRKPAKHAAERSWVQESTVQAEREFHEYHTVKLDGKGLEMNGDGSEVESGKAGKAGKERKEPKNQLNQKKAEEYVTGEQRRISHRRDQLSRLVQEAEAK